MLIMKTNFGIISIRTEGYKVKFIRFFPILSDSYSSSNIITLQGFLLPFQTFSMSGSIEVIFFMTTSIHIKYIHVYVYVYIHTTHI